MWGVGSPVVVEDMPGRVSPLITPPRARVSTAWLSPTTWTQTTATVWR
jgi:hypothetical protein